LACDYCYARAGDLPDLTPKMFHDEFEKVRGLYPEDATFRLVIYGGEPLMNRDLISYLATLEDIESMNVVTGLGAKLVIAPKVSYCFSIDPPSDLYHRKTIGGESFYHRAIQRIAPYAETSDSIYLRATLTNEAWNYRELWQGVKLIYPRQRVFVKPESVAGAGGLSPEVLARLREFFREEAVKMYKTSRVADCWNSYLVNTARDIFGPYPSMGGCGTFSNRLVISSLGVRTFCNEAPLGESGDLGFVFWSSEEERARLFSTIADFPGDCSRCSVRHFCGVTCPLNILKGDTSVCRYRRMVVEEILSAFFEYTPLPAVVNWIAGKYSKPETREQTLSECLSALNRRT